ncbi:TPA: LOW QUALITY PROTEIN: hypothetical protein N0F65_002843 [Lagenidium giganteum]|uniref:NF-kappa-B-activating protein C-terminal domain-containing protein n=1 Tax=Lagenidium giganteum TaxID=4803 RepID=A0AAV2ZBW6_9STRA|nr:TPA: LOW QUALITY PROTEIN: hypothetical protein N0F65_002843 [Lagenidium giganteum]
MAPKHQSQQRKKPPPIESVELSKPSTSTQKPQRQSQSQSQSQSHSQPEAVVAVQARGAAPAQARGVAAVRRKGALIEDVAERVRPPPDLRHSQRDAGATVDVRSSQAGRAADRARGHHLRARDSANVRRPTRVPGHVTRGRFDGHRGARGGRGDNYRGRGNYGDRDNGGRGGGGRRFFKDESDGFYEQRAKERDALQFCIWDEFPSPPPMKTAAKQKTKPADPPTPPPSSRQRKSSAASNSSSEDSSSDSSSESDSNSSDSEEDRRRRKRRSARSKSSRKSSSSRKRSSRKSSKSSKSKRRRDTESSRSARRRRKRSVGSSSESEEDKPSSDRKAAESSDSEDDRKKQKSRRSASADSAKSSEMDEEARIEAEKFKAAVQRKPEEEDEDDGEVGPMPLPETEETAAASMNYGKALLPGEGAAIAQYVQKNMRIPRRGEVGWNGMEIEGLEQLGYVMSGSRHKRMNAVRIRKENQVYTAEEKRALALINFEEKQQRENAVMNEFREMLTERLTKKHGSRLVEDMETITTDNDAVAAHWLRDAGHQVVVFEKAATLGGVWKYDDASLRTNLPTAVMQLPDFPFPRHTRSFPSHTHVLDYIQAYAKHFRVDELVRTNVQVSSIRRAESSSRWNVFSTHTANSTGDEQVVDAVDKVVVCNGHFAQPVSPTVEGLEHFQGKVVHSHNYRTPDQYVNKRVLLIGKGPSGQDISLELAANGAAEVVVAFREFDPAEHGNGDGASDRRVLKPNVSRILPNGDIEFTDGTSMPQPDALMFCTGYAYTAASLLPPGILLPSAQCSTLRGTIDSSQWTELVAATADGCAIAPLYNQVFAIEEPDFAFIGLPFKNLPFLCFELQARWIARVYADKSLPSKGAMYEELSKELAELPFPPRHLHRLGSERQQGYFSDLADKSGTTWNHTVQQMFDDAGYLRHTFPFDYREAEYKFDETTNTWTRRMRVTHPGHLHEGEELHLLDAGVDVVILEQRDAVGGVWRYDPSTTSDGCMYKCAAHAIECDDSELVSAVGNAQSLRTNLPTALMSLSGVPYPVEGGCYPSHDVVLQYLEGYAARFGLFPYIRFSSTVQSVTKTATGDAWELYIAPVKGEPYVELVDRVAVCNGHYAVPSYGQVPGISEFKGIVVHSRSYRTPEPYVGKRVLVVGYGPSGHDISLELAAKGALQVTVSVRGETKYAFPANDQRVIKPAIERIERVDSMSTRTRVVFTDGSTMDEPDVILLSTGYEQSVRNFLPSDLLYPGERAVKHSRESLAEPHLTEVIQATEQAKIVAPLYQQVFAIEDPTVAFVGLIKHTIVMCGELQAQWVAQVFAGTATLPSRDDMYKHFAGQTKQFLAGGSPVDMLHCLGSRQPQYFADLTAETKVQMPDHAHEMFMDAAVLMLRLPTIYRSATYERDPVSGRWVRTIAVPATATSAARVDGLEVVVFEQTVAIGGIWRFSDDAKTGSSMYKRLRLTFFYLRAQSLRTNLPTEVMRVRDLHYRPDAGSYPKHTDMLASLEQYAADFELLDNIRFSTTVSDVAKTPDGDMWEITAVPAGGDAYSELFDRVVVCNGHYTLPFFGDIPGMAHFKGELMHSREYRTPHRFEGKRVLLVGYGPSGHDISLELAANGAAEVVVSIRGRTKFAMPENDRRIIKPAIDRIEPNHESGCGHVVFADGSAIDQPDVIICCTGYRHAVRSFVPQHILYPNDQTIENSKPFFRETGEYSLEALVEAAKRQEVVAPLYQHVFAIEDPTLAFIGVTKRTNTLLCFDLQAQWVAHVFAGLAALPSKIDMYKQLATEMNKIETWKEPMRMIHSLGPLEPKYFDFITSQTMVKLPDVLNEMFVDSAILLYKCPDFYRDAVYEREVSSGKWKRTLNVPATATKPAWTDIRVFGEPYGNPWYKPPQVKM